MPLLREISKPNGEEAPPTMSWKHSLRETSRSPTRSRSARSPSPGLKSSLRRSTGSTGNLSASRELNGTKSLELTGIEQEYIKNLQQQVYYLELESNYLRGQARKAQEMHPVMTAEAERMLMKLREMQTQNDGLNLEITRLEGLIDVQNAEKTRLLEQLRSSDNSATVEKGLLTDEIVTYKKDKALLERDGDMKNLRISQLEDERAEQAMKTKTLEMEICRLNDSYNYATGQLKLMQDALDEKRSELIRTDNDRRETEERYATAMAVREKVSREFQHEVDDLRRKLKEAEYAADQERLLRSNEVVLMKENSLLLQQVKDLQSQVVKERELRTGADSRRATEINDLIAAREQIKQLKLELSSTRDQVYLAQEKNKVHLTELNRKEEKEKTASLGLVTAQSRLNDLETLHRSTDAENSQLRRDKSLLVDHVSELQRQLETKNSENVNLLSRINLLEKHLNDIEHQKRVETTLQSQKWGELETLAESMKNLSHTMSSTAKSMEKS